MEARGDDAVLAPCPAVPHPEVPVDGQLLASRAAARSGPALWPMEVQVDATELGERPEVRAGRPCALA